MRFGGSGISSSIDLIGGSSCGLSSGRCFNRTISDNKVMADESGYNNAGNYNVGRLLKSAPPGKTETVT